MANVEKGEVGIDAEGKTFVLRFNVNALCALENRAGCRINEFSGKFEQDNGADFATIRLLFWGALQGQYPEGREDGVDLNRAGEILSQVGIVPGMEAAAQALALAFPDEPEGETDDTDPSQAPGGAGAT